MRRLLLLCLVLQAICLSYTQQPEESEAPVSDDEEPFQPEETGSTHQVSGGWGTTRWKREQLLGQQDTEECMRQIRSSMKCACGLRETVVDVPSIVDGEMFTFPRCVNVKMCTGPCMGKNMKCMPTDTVDVPVPVMNHDCRKKFATVVAHKGCRCTCMLTAKSCGDRQVFNSKKCQCECKRRPCLPDYYFHDQNCRCECLDTLECSTGTQFNPETCECDPDNTI